MVFHWSLSDSKSPQVSRTRLRIQAVLSHAVVWIVSTLPPTSKFSRPFNNPLVIVPKAPITIGTIVTFMFHSCFKSIAKSRYLSFFSLSFAGTGKSTILQILFSFFLLIIMRSGLLAGIRWSVCMLKSHRSLCESLLLLLLLLLFSLRVFHVSFNWWSFTGVWVTASFLKSPELFSVFNNAVVWMVSTRPPTSKSASPFSNPLVTVPNAPITIGIIVTCMFHSFFSYLARSRYLSFFSHSFSFILWSAGTAKSTILQVLYFFFGDCY